MNAAVLQQLQAQQQAEGGATVVAGQAQIARESLAIPNQAAVPQQQQPQVITLSQLQNFLPIHHQSGQHHVTAVASTESTAQSQQTTSGAPGVKTFASSTVAPTVVSVQGVSGQFLQVCWDHFRRHSVCHSRDVSSLIIFFKMIFLFILKKIIFDKFLCSTCITFALWKGKLTHFNMLHCTTTSHK